MVETVIEREREREREREVKRVNIEMLPVYFSVSIHVGGMGNWTADGCITHVRQSNQVASNIECQCFHLTNFAILVVRLQVAKKEQYITLLLYQYRTYQEGSSPTSH